MLRNSWVRAGLAAPALPLLAAAVWFGWVKFGTANFGAVVPGQVYRSAYPTPGNLREWTRDYGLRAILCLMSHREADSLEGDRAVAAELGLARIEIPLKVNRLPCRGEILPLVRALETAPRPVLIHCKVGADRTGVASVMAAMAVGGMSFAEARRHLTFRHLHIRAAVADLFSLYEQDCLRQGIPTGGWDSFCSWLQNSYRPEHCRVACECSKLSTAAPVSLPLVSAGRQVGAGSSGSRCSERERTGPGFDIDAILAGDRSSPSGPTSLVLTR